MRFGNQLLAILALLWCLPLASAQAEIKFGIAAEPYAPFSSKDTTGHWVGWEIDLMRALCADLGETCAVTEVAWDGIIPALQAKKFDVVMASMAVTSEREKVIDFSNVYYTSIAVLAGSKEGEKIIDTAQLSDKMIGVQISTIHAAYATKNLAPKGALIKTYQTQDEANTDLAAGRLDYVLADAVMLGAFVDSDAGACCEIKGPVPYDTEIFGPGVGFGLRKGEDALKAKLNKGIADLVKNGVLEHITRNAKLFGKIGLPKQD